MPHIVLFHSGLGRRPQILRWAERLRERGHNVHTPDLYDGEVFDNLDDGIKKRDALGIEELARRGQDATRELPLDCLYAGFSLGAASAQALALHRPGARGAFLMHAALPLAAFGQKAWPDGLPVEIHFAQNDPWVEHDVIDALEAQPHTTVKRYAGDAHLFADDDSPEYDAVAAETMFTALAAFADAHAPADRT